jgi:CHAD domain-containing protein
MIKRKRQLKYAQKQNLELLKQFNAYTLSPNMKTLHNVRLCLKKIKSFLIVVSKCGDKKLLSAWEVLHPIFVHAGHIRNIEVNSKLSHTIEIPLAELESKQHSLLSQQLFLWDLHHLEYLQAIVQSWHIIRYRLKPLSRKDVFKNQSSMIKDICIFFESPLTNEEDLHKMRKNLKILIYTSKWVGTKKMLRINIDYIDTLQELIGEWHDAIVAIDWIETIVPEQEVILNKLHLQARISKEKIILFTADIYDNILVL